MKKLLPLIFVFILSSCSKEVSSDQLVVRNGISYPINSVEPFTGIEVSYHENGQLRSKVNKKNGKTEGLYERYFKNGQTEYLVNYKNGKMEGLYERFHENGQLKETKSWKMILNSEYPEKHGKWKYFDEGGNLTKIEVYEEGNLIETQEY